MQEDWAGKNTVLVQANYVHENRSLPAGYALGLASNTADTLNTARATLSYFYKSTYGFSTGYFDASGTSDPGLYALGPIAGSVAASPNSNGYLLGATYTPFGKEDSPLSPWVNVRIGLQYFGYTKFNGAKLDYDGYGRSASANDTLFGYIWLAF
jgi:hypothetical protein